MTRVVVHVQWRPELDPDTTEVERDQQWADIFSPLFERAGALGGRVIGWAQRDLVVDFAWDGLYDAIDFLVDAPLAPELASGVACGELAQVMETGRVAVALGPPVREAEALVQLARPGEVLITPELVDLAEGQIGTAGEAGTRPGRPQIRALILDPDRPFRESLPSIPPSSQQVFELVPSSESPEDGSPSSRAPDATVHRQVERMAHAAETVSSPDLGVFPPEVSSALRKRDAESLKELARTARQHEAVEAADRLDAIAALASGKSGEALRRLRRAKEATASDDLSARCRAALALAVALASAGRPYEAALEGLEGLARAREGKDERGERACARFLAQVSGQLGDAASSEVWAQRGA